MDEERERTIRKLKRIKREMKRVDADFEKIGKVRRALRRLRDKA